MQDTVTKKITLPDNLTDRINRLVKLHGGANPKLQGVRVACCLVVNEPTNRAAISLLHSEVELAERLHTPQ